MTDESDESIVLSPLQRVASGKEEELFRILNEASQKSSPNRNAAQKKETTLRFPKIPPPPPKSAMAAYNARSAYRTPSAASIPQLAYVGKEDLDTPCTWLCGKCEERAVGRFCHNCGTECLLASPERLRRQRSDT